MFVFSDATSPTCSTNHQGNHDGRENHPSAQDDSCTNSQQSRYQTNTNTTALLMQGQQSTSSVLGQVATDLKTQTVPEQQSTASTASSTTIFTTDVSSQHEQQQNTSQTLLEQSPTSQHWNTSVVSSEQITINPLSWQPQDEQNSSIATPEHITTNLVFQQIQEKVMSSVLCEHGIKTEDSNLVINNYSSLRDDNTYEDDNAVIEPIIIKPESDEKTEGSETQEYESSGNQVNEGSFTQECSASNYHEYSASVNQKHALASQQEYEANYHKFGISSNQGHRVSANQENEAFDTQKYEASTLQTYSVYAKSNIVNYDQCAPRNCQQTQLFQTEGEPETDEQVQQRHSHGGDQMIGIHPTTYNHTAMQGKNTEEDRFITETKDVLDQSWSLKDAPDKEVPSQKEDVTNEDIHKGTMLREEPRIQFDPHWEARVKKPSGIIGKPCTSKNTSQGNSLKKTATPNQGYCKTSRRDVFQCYVCKKSFTRGDKFIEHNMTEHAKVCHVCNKSFTSKDLLRNHSRLHNQYFYSTRGKSIGFPNASTDQNIKSFTIAHQNSLGTQSTPERNCSTKILYNHPPSAELSCNRNLSTDVTDQRSKSTENANHKDDLSYMQHMTTQVQRNTQTQPTHRHYQPEIILQRNSANEIMCQDKPPTDVTSNRNSPNEIAQSMLNPGDREKKTGDITHNRNQHTTNTNLEHNSYKAYICKICGQAFTYRCSLARHVRIHNGERPFLHWKRPRTEKYSFRYYCKSTNFDGYKIWRFSK